MPGPQPLYASNISGVLLILAAPLAGRARAVDLAHMLRFVRHDEHQPVSGIPAADLQPADAPVSLSCMVHAMRQIHINPAVPRISTTTSK